MFITVTKTGNIAYKQSGNISLKAIYLFTVFAFSIIPIIGILYSILIWYIPVIYFNFIITIIFGLFLGLLVYPIVKYGHVRSYVHELLAGFGLGIAGLYFSWAAHIVLVLNIDETRFFYDAGFTLEDFIKVALSPIFMVKTIVELSKYGTWSIGNIPFTDFALYGVWFFEAATLLVCIVKANDKWSFFPYSEMRQEWANMVRLSRKMILHRGFNKFKEALEQDDLSIFYSTPITDSRNMEFSELVLYVFQDDTISYLSFFNKYLVKGENGKKVQKYENMTEYYALTASQRKLLIEFYGIEDKEKNGNVITRSFYKVFN